MTKMTKEERIAVFNRKNSLVSSQYRSWLAYRGIYHNDLGRNRMEADRLSPDDEQDHSFTKPNWE